MAGVGITLGILFVVAPLAQADVPSQPELYIREINISGDNFVVLQNVGADIAKLSDYWLGYASASASSPLVPTQQLPDVPLANGQAIVALNDGTTDTCDASYVARLPFDFAKSGGTFMLWRLDSSVTGSLTFRQVDVVQWANPSAQSTVVSPGVIDVRQETSPVTIANPVWYRDATQPMATWQVGDLSACNFAVYDTTTTTWQPTISWPQASASPPSIQAASIVVGGSPAGTPSIPASDKGLQAVQLSELLPNTTKPQTDANDEFIELYNPNDTPFDLSGFMLQTASTGSATVHTYHFPAGTTIKPKQFAAYKSAQTHLALTNSGGQVWLVDPLGTTVTQSDPYGKADDGLAWVNANGKWQWTALATPGATNKVATPVQAGAVKTATVSGKKVAAVAASSTAGTVAGAHTTAEDGKPTTTVHPLTLAVVILAALLYGAYEYRHDLALRYQQFRRNRAARR